MNDFQTLGLKPGATAEEAKAAWRRLAKENHPDTASDKNAAGEAMALINAAYDRIKEGNPQMGTQARGSKTAGARSTNPFSDFPDFEEAFKAQQERQRRDAEERRRAEREQQARQQQTREQPGANAERREEPKYRRGAEERGPGYTRGPEAAGHRYTQQEQTSAQGRGDNAARDFYAQARRQEELRAAAERRAAAEGKTAPAREAVSEMAFSKPHREAMKEALDKRMKAEAYKRVTELRGGIYPDPRARIDTNRGDLPGFHMADLVSFKGRTMEIHMAGDAKDGRNIIAMPEMSLVGGKTVRQGAGVRLFEINGESGKAMPIDAKNNPVANAQGLDVRVVFGSERARARSAQGNDAR